MKPVDILGGIDAVQYERGVDMGGQGQLDQYAMHAGVGVQLVDQHQQRVLGMIDRQPMFDRQDADARAFADLAADIDLARWIVADQHHRQRWWLAGLYDQHRHARGGFVRQGARHGAPVQHLGHAAYALKTTVRAPLRNTRPCR